MARKSLATIINVDLPKAGTRIEPRKSCPTVESSKATFEATAPISRELIEINESLASAPENLNRDPHGAGWLVKAPTGKEPRF